uniref:Tetraspanin n=1 Tax=Dermatophagoides pteronyssinus TaxID=6956 RepID=A0A6P6Y595_DERPT
DFTFISLFVKYSLFFFNLLFWLIGTTLISLGVWSFLEEYNQYNLFKLNNIFDFFLHISVALILSGTIIFSMSLMGCLGALRENLCLIKLYSLMLLILFVGEIIISSLAFIFPQNVLNFLKNHLSKDMITKYREDTNLQNLIDIIQLQFKCCGISDYGYKDWSMNIYFNCTYFNPSSERCAVPYSCCRNLKTEIDTMCGYNMQNLSSVIEINKYVYTRGCVEAISELVDHNMNLVAIICLGSALAQLFAMFLARSLQGQIFAQRARWM